MGQLDLYALLYTILKDLLTLLSKAYLYISRQKKGSPDGSLSLPFSGLDQRLHRKYPKTSFYIADNQQAFYRLISRELVACIKKHLDNLQAVTTLTNEKVRVGLVCGPMVFKTAEWLRKYYRFSAKDKLDKVVFVAMNKAAEAESFQFSANYLVTAFSNQFPGSGSIAYTQNAYDHDLINHHRQNIDILLCSVGSSVDSLTPGSSIETSEKNYINRWFDSLPAERKSGASLSPSCIGDFCLTPIDADGRVVYDKEMALLIRAELDPYPRLTHVREIRHSPAPFLIFPVNTGDSARKGEQKSQSIEEQVTGKEQITRAVLRSGAVNVCILSRALAKNLERAVGGFIIHEMSRRPVNDSGLRRCRAYDLTRHVDREIAVFDPNFRIEQLSCKVNEALQPPLKTTDIIPSIIISELTHEADEYNWGKDTGVFQYNIDDSPYRFWVDKDVRRPGQWAIISALQANRFLKNVHRQEQMPLSIWDLGCGCGIIGILAGKLSPGIVGKILFSDIDDRALRCAENNVKDTGLQSCAEFRRGDLFKAAAPGEKFHSIIFNPPFLPMSGITNIGSSADAGGDKGEDLAKKFCTEVHDYLQDGGGAILVVPDYIDDGHLKRILDDKFGPENVRVHNRFILYPCRPTYPIPTAYEIQYQETIENNCNYNFENIFFGSERFIAFRMRHYIATRAR